MRFTVVVLIALILLLLAGVIPVGKGLDAGAVYYSPVTILLFALLCGASVMCCFKRKFGLNQLGFYLVHIGTVLVLCGAMTGYLAGKKGIIQLFLNPSQPVSQISLADGTFVDLGFDVAAEDFQVKFYPPVYDLYRPIPADRLKPGQMPFEKTEELDASGKTTWNIEGIGEFVISNLWVEARGEWTEQRRLESGGFLHRALQTPSYFGVVLRVDDQAVPISINHPAGYKGWRFYLQSYDQRRRSYVVLSARRDPGRIMVISGIWMMMTGMFALCFQKREDSR